MSSRIYIPLAVRAAAAIRLRRIHNMPAAVTDTTDPLERLFDPTFLEPLWIYDGSRLTTPEVPGKLHPKQLEALNQQSTHRWLFWGNQTGKTTFGAIDMVLSALGRHPRQLAGYEPMPPFMGWASALSWELWEKILLPELLTWIPRDQLIDAPQPYISSPKRDIVIRADNGTESRITGKAAEQGAAKYQSARVNKVWADEEHPESVWDEMQPRLLRNRGTTLCTMTPIKGMTYVYGRFYEPVKLGAIATSRHWFSHAGIADNPSITADALAELRLELQNNPSQLAARERGLFVRPVGAVYNFDLAVHGIDVDGEAALALVRRSQCFGGIDLGKWRFAFSWGCVERSGDEEGTLTMMDEVFSQNETSRQRAQKIHDQLKSYGVKDIDIWADNAAPDELKELNAAFEAIGSPYMVMAVEARNKSRSRGILHIESLLERRALRVRRGMGRDMLWYRGKNSGSNGQPVHGSRWVWEITNWQYPKTADGKVQKDDPDDATADGADMMDNTRYFTLQGLGPPDDAPVQKGGKSLAQLEAAAVAALEAGDDDEQDEIEGQDRGPVLRQ